MTTPLQIEPVHGDAQRCLDDKLRQLEDILRPMGRVLVAYSGGVDSAMLVVAAHRVLGDRVIAVTADSESYASGELERARDLLEPWGIRHEVIRTHELDDPDYARNPVNRCYFCKSAMLSQMRTRAAELGADHILYGQNVDDLGDFRPGAEAARQFGARAPLQEAGLTKQDVRDLARRWGIPVWNRPAMACLSSRFPYGTPVTAEGLRLVDRAEAFLRGLGYEQLRVRHHTDLARLELPAADLAALLADAERRSAIAGKLRELGYGRVTVDLRGFRSGSLNEVLDGAVAADERICADAERLAADRGLGPARAGRCGQVLCLTLPPAAAARLADDGLRAGLVESLEGLGARYAALDL